MGAGQFSIFGAIEEKSGRGFPGLEHVKNSLATWPFLPWMAAISYRRSGEEKIWQSGQPDCPQRVHRKCRKAVLSFQLGRLTCSERLRVGLAGGRATRGGDARILAGQC